MCETSQKPHRTLREAFAVNLRAVLYGLPDTERVQQEALRAFDDAEGYVKKWPAAQPETCEWKQEEGDAALYVTGCDHVFEFPEATSTIYGLKFCCYCGKKLREVPCNAD